MTHRAKVVATYRLNEHELVQVATSVTASFPDAVAEAKATAIAGVREILDDIYTRERVAATDE